jgi:nitrogen fixation NifU-like protein
MTDDPWTAHSLTFLEMAFRTDRQMPMPNPSGWGRRKGVCGDAVEFYIRLDGDIVREITYQVNGCMNTNACANALIAMAEAKSLGDAWRLTPEMVADRLQSLPPDHFHCAELAVGAFYRALSDCRRQGRAGWKTVYRRRKR